MRMTPTTAPIATPPTATSTNWRPASQSEKAPVTTAAVANRRATSAVASLTRLSPSSTVATRPGTPSRPMIAVVATASGGETMAPRTNASGHPSPGTTQCAAAATAAVVASTRPTANSEMGRVLNAKSRHEVL